MSLTPFENWVDQAKPVKVKISLRWSNCPRSFTIRKTCTAFLAPARLFSYKTLIFALLHVKSAILVAFYYAFKAHNPRRIWSHFSGISTFTKNTYYTPGYTEVTPRTCWLSTPLSCTKIKSSRIERSIQFDCTIFVWVRFSSIEFDWVRFTRPGVLSTIDLSQPLIKLFNISTAGTVSHCEQRWVQKIIIDFTIHKMGL